MSTAEDYRPCRACGSLTDSLVCSQQCADDLDEQARQKIEHERAAAGQCTNCGEPICSDCGGCHDCADLWLCPKRGRAT